MLVTMMPLALHLKNILLSLPHIPLGDFQHLEALVPLVCSLFNVGHYYLNLIYIISQFD